MTAGDLLFGKAGLRTAACECGASRRCRPEGRTTGQTAPSPKWTTIPVLPGSSIPAGPAGRRFAPVQPGGPHYRLRRPRSPDRLGRRARAGSRAVRRRMTGAASATVAIQSAAAIQSTTATPVAHEASAAENPIPVAAVSQAARHNGHFGSNTRAAPGRIEAATRESRRAGRGRPAPPVQHCRLITHHPRAGSTRRSRAASRRSRWHPARNRRRTCRGAAPMPW